MLAPAPPEAVARRLDAMRAALAHRGPDGDGQIVEPAGGDRTLGLGHVRLSIIAPQTAAQPMTGAEGRLVLSFNGEIYNYPELQADLTARGHSFAAASDSETLLAAYAEWGPDCLTRLRGMFAFAIWDRQRRRLVLARDAVGKKPLWLRAHRGCLAFASELQALAGTGSGLPEADAEADPAGIAAYLLYKYLPPGQSLLRGLRELPPGCWAEIDPAAAPDLPAPRRWYHPPVRRPAPGPLTDDTVADFRSQCAEAVAVRLRSDVPVGVFLSGGLDSSAILALAAEQTSAPFDTFSVDFADGEEGYSEAWAADLVAKRFGARHHVLSIDAKRFGAGLERATWHRGQPMGEPNDMAFLELAGMARDHVKVVLCGEGADELLAGYPRYRGEVWAARYRALAPRACDPLLRWLGAALPYRARRAGIVLRAAAERDFITRQAGWFGAMTPEDLAQLAPDLAGRAVMPDGVTGAVTGAEQDQTAGGPAAMQAAMAFDRAVWLPGNLLSRGDRMTMAEGIEMRMPFMDTDLAAHVAALPDGAFADGRAVKVVLRRAMAGDLPAEIATRRKHGFRVPFHEWIRGPLREHVADRLLGSGAHSRAFLPRAGVERLWDAHSAGRRNHEKILWVLLALELYLAQLAQGLPHAPPQAPPQAPLWPR